jgi:iron complex outermembrane receptor protein
MNYNITKTTVRWKRFSRASWAAFQSLNKEVQIGVLTVAMLSSAGLKAKDLSSAEVMETIGSDSIREELLEDVEVLSTRVPLTAEQAPRQVTVLQAEDINAAAVHSINDLLEYAVGVDVRQRGEFGVQTDISVRGGNFDQITLLLNGINISSPHTGHLSADFPVTVQDIERIEILEGPAARVFGTSAFTGVINIVTKSPAPLSPTDDPRNAFGGRAHLYGGSYGYAGGDLSLQSAHTLGQKTSLTNLLSGGYSRSDGATPNSDFGSTRAFYQGKLRHKQLQLDGQLGYSYKDFGANTFYGAASTDQWESNERYIAALRMRLPMGEHWNLSADGHWNRWFDHYQWHRGTNVYGNFHKVDASGLHANLGYSTAHQRTSLGYEIRFEGIYSTRLGEPLDPSEYVKTGGHDANDSIRYTHHGSRQNHNIYLEHDILLDSWTFSLGLLANHNTGLDSKWRIYPGIDISWHPTHEWKVFGSWNMALRMPTYTDLYYSGVNIIGNQDLKPEKTMDVSLGARYRHRGWRAEVQAFYSHKTDMIDWVIFANEADGKTFRSTNFKSDNTGVEVNLAFFPAEIWSNTPLQKFGVQWAYLNEESKYDEEILASTYAMMFLRHKLIVQAETRIVSHLNLAANWRFMDRIGAENPSYALLDLRLSWDANRWSIYADVNNALDKTYYEYEHILQPGILFKGGFKWRF